MNKKEEKLGFKRLISNLMFTFKYAFGHDKKMSFSYVFSMCVFDGLNAFINTFILKEIIEVLTTGAELQQIIFLLAMQIILNIIALTIHIALENFLCVRLVRFSGEIQRELMEKARKIDLKCYDTPEYYDDFVIAASQSEEMCANAIISIAKISGSITAMLVAGTVIISVNPIVAIFPVVGFVINIITRFIITKLEYQYEIEKAKIGRKADYSKRVFYQPEYAKEIKLSGIEEALIEQYDEAIAQERKMALKYSLKIIPPTLINWICTYTICQFFAVPVYLAYQAIVKGTVQLGEVASLTNATNMIKSRLDNMNYNLVNLQKIAQYAERFRRFLDFEVNIEGTEGTEPICENDYTLEIKNVSFKDKNDEKYILKNINLTIKKGEKIALVGENGAGKTTLIKLIMRLYDVTEGVITFGGVDIKKLNIRKYRKKIGLVFQDFQIYGATLAENIKTDFITEEDKEKITLALTKSDFGNKLETMAEGIDTELTKEFDDNGVTLSGGEAQKTAIARMFMQDMSLAILDEPSSALDPIAEYRLNKSMMKNTENKSVILISHRLSTTKDADRIVLLKDGCISEIGTHSELIAQNGTYAKMWRVQAEKYCANIYS